MEREEVSAISLERGITLTSLCFRLSNEMALTSSLSIGQVHHHFKDNYVLSTENGVSAMTLIDGETLKKSYISYNAVSYTHLDVYKRQVWISVPLSTRR